MSPPTIRGLEKEVEELTFRGFRKELWFRGGGGGGGTVLVCSCGGGGGFCGGFCRGGDGCGGGDGEWRCLAKTLSDVIFCVKGGRVRILVVSLGASTTPIYSSGSSSTPIYSPGSSSLTLFLQVLQTTSKLFSRTLRESECSNCKHLLDKITVLEATVDMYMHPEQHTVNSAALFHEENGVFFYIVII
ncbi:hypothetical protein Tco_1166506 [Tanacetum coccineum]